MPQGSLWGPLVYSIFLNDLLLIVTNPVYTIMQMVIPYGNSINGVENNFRLDFVSLLD